jgi:hypothetical protein
VEGSPCREPSQRPRATNPVSLPELLPTGNTGLPMAMPWHTVHRKLARLRQLFLELVHGRHICRQTPGLSSIHPSRCSRCPSRPPGLSLDPPTWVRWVASRKAETPFCCKRIDLV